MFSRIARRYDFNNRLHSLARDQAWRRTAARAARITPGERVLDVACGTGDLTAMLARKGARVTGLDSCDDMLAVARRKCRKLDVQWVVADARELPFEAASFDVVTIAFGVRNIVGPRAALAQFARVLRPGGRLVVLEFHPDVRDSLAGRCLSWFVGNIMSRTAGYLAGDRQGAYDYLHKSVQSFLSAAELADAIAGQGFVDVTTRPLALGLAAVHCGRRP